MFLHYCTEVRNAATILLGDLNTIDLISLLFFLLNFIAYFFVDDNNNAYYEPHSTLV